MTKPILLSVVVACYNVADYLEECLDSLAKQTYKKIEVILIDDCSTDGGRTATLVDSYGKKYANFHSYHNEHNLGLSDTRNRGINLANGDYIAFADGDDIIPEDAYLKLVSSVSQKQAQVVTGFVRRFDKNRDKPSYLHKFAISDTILGTTLERNPELVYDSTSWNKIYNLEMVRRHQLRFPANMLYEDIPFVMRAFTIASKESSINVLSDVVYRWRWRDGDSKSITQVKNAMKPYGDRLKILNMVRQNFIHDKVSNKILQTFYVKVLTIDIPLFMDDIADADDDFILDFQRATYLFLRDWELLDSKLYERLSIKMQSQYKALLSGDFAELKKYSYSGYKGNFTKRIIHHFLGTSSKSVMNSVGVTNQITTVKAVNLPTKLGRKNQIQIEGYLQPNTFKLHRIWGTSANLNEQLSAHLLNIDNQKRFAVKAIRESALFNVRLHGQLGPYARYQASFDSDEALEALGAGTWKLELVIKHSGQVLTSYAGQPVAGSARMHTVSNPKLQLSLIQKYNNQWELTFTANKTLDVKTTHEVNDENSLIDIATDKTSLELTFKVRSGLNQPLLRFTKQQVGSVVKHEKQEFVFRISMDDLEKMKGSMTQLEVIDAETNVAESYAFNRSKKFEIFHMSDADVFVSYLGTYGIWLMKEVPILPLKTASWDVAGESSALDLKVALPSDWPETEIEGLGSVELLATNKKNRYLSIGIVSVDGRDLQAKIPLIMNKQLKVLSGNYRIYLVLPGKKQIRVRVFDPNHVAVSMAEHDNQFGEFTLTENNDGFANLSVKQRVFWLDKTQLCRGISYSILYPLMRMLPLNKKMVVFESYWGDYFNGSPKAMYDYLRTNHPELKFVWIFTNDQIQTDGQTKVAKRLGFKYWYYLARAKYLVQNTNFPNQYSKRAGQIEVETLHGTFMKTMGFDEPHFKNGSARIQKNFAIRNNRWDLLTVPSQYMADTATRAFDYQHEVVKSGFPRNDALYQHNTKDYIQNVKQRLKIPLDKKVVLYAPTFRNNDSGSFDFELDLEKLRAKLSDQYVVLVRLHYFVAHSMSFLDQHGFVWDVSDYPDIADLYLISDVMITDYSSVMFDYGHLKRPMIFFAYDKDWYLNGDNRGVYLNYDQTVPGPVVTSTDQVIDLLTNLDHLQHKYADKIEAFYDKFCTYGRDGNASEVISERMLSLVPAEQLSVVRHLFWKKVLRAVHLKDFQSKLLNFLSRHLWKRNIIILESFFGTQYSDSPKAIYLYLKRKHPEYKLYWNVNRHHVAYFKEHHIPYIVRFGYRGIFKQAQAKYWFTNTRRPFRWQKPQGVKLIQTWHGTPLKTIGTDVQTVTMPGVTQRKYHQQVIRDSARWDYLIAPNQYSYDIMQRAFRKPYAQMISSGYPRNDILHVPDSAQIASIKANLNIDGNAKVVLYAPTWRDNDYVRADEYRADLHLNLEMMLDQLQPDTVILIRTHYLIANQLDLSKYGSRVVNVSDYEDIMELYLIANVLITDYSSVMFDFANLQRPMLFFAYDLDEYADDIRGFYVDYQQTVPGPIVKTNEEVVSTLNDMLVNPNKYVQTAKYQDFQAKFTSWEDGRSTERLVEYVLENKQYGISQQELAAEQVKIKDGSQLWSGIPNTPSAKFIKNLNISEDEKFQQLSVARLQDPIRKQDVGQAFVEIKNMAISKQTFWVRQTDIKVK